MEADPGSPSTDGNQSSTTSGYYSDIDYQRADSHQHFQPSSWQDYRRRSGLTPSEEAEFYAKWPLLQRGYYQAEPNVTADKYATSWRQTIDDRSNANLMTPKWTETSLVNSEYDSDESSDDEYFTQMRLLEAEKLKRRKLIARADESPAIKQQWHFSQAVPSAPGVKSATYQRHMSHVPKSSITATVASADGVGFSSTSGNYSPTLDSGKAFDELSGSESFNPAPLAENFMMKSVHDRQMDSQRQPLMRDQNIRSKLPVLQTRYSPEVWNEAKGSPFTTSWHRDLNFDGSSNDSIDTTPPSSKELNENGEGASRQDTLLASIQEPKTIGTQDENTEAVELNNESTTLADASNAIKSVNENLRSIESKPPANESSDAEINKSEETTPVVEAPAEMPQFTDPTANVNNHQSIEEKEIPPTESPKTFHQMINVPTTSQGDASYEMIVSVPALSDHRYNAPIGEERSAMPQQSQLTYIHSMNIDYGELLKDVILPPDRPMDCDYFTINVPVLLQHDALVEPIAQTEHFYMKSMDEGKIAATPQVSPAKLVLQSSNDSVPNSYIPAVSQGDMNEVRAPADLSDTKSIGEEKCVTAPQLPTAAFAVPSQQMQPLQQQPIVAQMPNPFQPPAYGPSSSLPSAAFAVPSQQMTSLQQQPIVAQMPNPFQPPAYGPSSSLPSAAFAVPSQQMQPLQQQPIVAQTPNPIQPTAYGPSPPVKTQKRPYNRSKKVQVKSNVQITPPQGSIIRAPLKSTDPNSSNMQNNFAPIQMASQAPQKLPLQYDAKSNQVNSLKRKIIDNSQPPVPAKVNYKSNEPAPSKVTAASLKRKNKENFAPPVPAKLQKVEKPSQVAMKPVATSSFSVNLPDITIHRVDRDDEQSEAVSSRAGQDSGNRSFAECLQFLQRNGVTVFKVPQKPSNKIADKYIKVLQKNNVTVERLSKKNVSRASNM